jgi:glycosyltransferase involved in cell wall biosynthesis
MNILFVTPYLASPPECGAQRRLEGLMRGLSQCHQITLLSFSPGTDRAPTVSHAYCKDVITIEHDVLRLPATAKRLLQSRSLLSRKSFEFLLYQNARFQSEFERLVQQNNYDVVQVEFSQMGIYRLPRVSPRQGIRSPQFVLDEHNIEYEIVKRTAESEGSFARRTYSSLNWRKVKREELDAWHRFDGVALTSARDELMLKNESPTTRTIVIPNAVDLDAFRPNQTTIEPKTLLFLGALDYHPNIDGMAFFLDEIWPKVVKSAPDAKLIVVGRNAPASLLARKNDSIDFTGYVDDPRVYLDRAAAVIVPLRIGGGTRFKIVEAMAKGKAIVSTRIGAEGLDTKHEQHLLLADDPVSFADSVCRVINDDALAARLGQSARDFAEARYGWNAAVAKLEAFYVQLSDGVAK